MSHKLALIGFGTVGQGLCEILLSKRDQLAETFGFHWEVTAVSDLLKGSVYCPRGLDVEKLLDLAAGGWRLEEAAGEGGGDAATGWDALETIRRCNADTVCEMTPTDLTTGEPAISHCLAAFEAGRHVVTCNKGPAALKYRELKSAAAARGVAFRIEGTVMSGTPVLNLAEGPLAGNTITAVRGILNGTTNYILTRMEAGQPFEVALKTAQDLGYAEADPTADVEGYDALAKVTILANVVMGRTLTPAEIPCTGITGLTGDDVKAALEAGKRWKLIGEIRQAGEGVDASVQPMKIDASHPLAGVGGATNAITFTTDLMGDVTVVGQGAGRVETGFSILTDVLAIHLKKG